MKTKLLLASLLVCIQVSAQTELGFKTYTRAFVIGISHYQDSSIPDLRFAHRDAQAFADYLHSPAGGSLSGEQIKLLVNKEATAGAIYAGFDWLLEQSKKGDQVILFYSGHGDVETKTKTQRGFLLAHDAPAANYWLGGTISLIFFQDIISELSSNGVQVTIYSDACHAGNLAGSNVDGPQLTAALLSQQFANEIKVLSCQADEYSLEGPQWGRGRGAFSFHLINGLYGFADENEDLQISLIEIENYLQDRVPKETAPHHQLPITIGNRWAMISIVDETLFANIKNKRNKKSAIFSKAEPRLALLGGAKRDSSLIDIYTRFESALKNGKLLYPEGKSAYAFYRQLKNEPAMASMQGLMVRNLVAALQDGAHQALQATQYLDPKELDAIYQGDEKYRIFPEYLALAAELLGPEHYLFHTLLSRQYYFEALHIRLRARQYLDYDSLYQEAIDLQLRALNYDSLSPHIFYELGLLYHGKRDTNQAILSFNTAIALSPLWSLPYLGMSSVFLESNQLDKAIYYGEQAVARGPEFAYAHLSLASLYKKTLQKEKCREHYLKSIQIYAGAIESFEWEDAPAHYFYILGNLYQQFGCDRKASIFLEEAVSRSNHFGPAISLTNLWVYYEYYQEADSLLRAMIDLWPGEPQLYHQLGQLYLELGEYSTAELLYQKSIEINPRFYNGYLSLALLYHQQFKDFKKAEFFYNKTIQTNPYDYMGFIRMGEFFFDQQLYLLAEKSYLQALQLKPNFLQVYIKLGEMYQYNMKRYQEALQMYEKVRETDYYNFQANMNLLALYRDHLKDTESGKQIKLLHQQQLSGIEDGSLSAFDYELNQWIQQNTKCFKN